MAKPSVLAMAVAFLAARGAAAISEVSGSFCHARCYSAANAAASASQNSVTCSICIELAV